jgi:hypothetical protein
MPLQQRSGNNTFDAYGGGAAAAPVYIEDVFSTYLYTGTGNGSGTTGTVATITNNVDLSTKGGLVWIKNRGRATDHGLYDTARGALNGLQSNLTSAQSAFINTLTGFTTSGFSLGNDGSNTVNLSGDRYVSWTFRKQPKFFDIVTYTGNGSGRTIAHNLGSVPGCIIIKRTSTGGSAWYVYHQSLGATKLIVLNSTNPAFNDTAWLNTAPTSTVFTISDDPGINSSGQSFVAYLFASNSGGFGLTGTDNVISCGSFTTDGSGNATVNLGYEPQWVLYRLSSAGDDWWMSDVLRGMSMTQSNQLFADRTDAEGNTYPSGVTPTSTGFTYSIGLSGYTGIYIAIRRGPMKVPTVGTSVFTPVTYTGTNAVRVSTAAGFPIDSILTYSRSGGYGGSFFDRLRGPTKVLETFGLSPEQTGTNSLTDFASMTGYTAGADTTTAEINYSGTYVNWNFRRVPGFFDEVCYTGTGAVNLGFSFNHNLTVTPELSFIRARSSTSGWFTWCAVGYPGGGDASRWSLNTDSPTTQTGYSSYYTPTLVYPYRTLDESGNPPNVNGTTYIAYLFASCPGVSKVGSYTGTGATQTINCGFTGGARFVLIKRTDTNGSWYVWDTARGMVSGTDPVLRLNLQNAEFNADYVYTTGVGFQIVTTAAGINESGGTYIFLAVA